MKTKEPTAGDVPLIGGALCLDFTNTVGSRLNGAGSDMLRDYADLLAWSVHAGALKAAEARGLLRAAARRPHAARAVRLRAIRLRSALYAVLHARVDGQAPRAGQLALLNRELARALARARLAVAAKGFAWEWDGKEAELDRMLWPIARSAAELLTSGALERVHCCANERCGWLFLDGSRNGSRRWCSMSDCGNRAKVRHYLARERTRRRAARRL